VISAANSLDSGEDTLEIVEKETNESQRIVIENDRNSKESKGNENKEDAKGDLEEQCPPTEIAVTAPSGTEREHSFEPRNANFNKTGAKRLGQQRFVESAQTLAADLAVSAPSAANDDGANAPNAVHDAGGAVDAEQGAEEAVTARPQPQSTKNPQIEMVQLAADGNGQGHEEKLKSIHSEINDSRNTIIGMLCVLTGVFLLISSDALFSYASTTMSISLLQCLLIANLVQHLLAWSLWFAPSSITRKAAHTTKWYGESEHRLLIWLRGVLYFCDDFFYWTGVSLLPLGDAECIYFLCPIFVAFGARLFLKEEFSKTFPLVLALTALGVLILSQPRWLTHLFEANGSGTYFRSEHIDLRGLFSLIVGCVCWALMNLTVRHIPKAHWTQLELTSSLQSFAIWTPLLIAINAALRGTAITLDNGGQWDWSLEALMVSAGIGTLSVFAFMFLVVGYQHGEATKVSWLEYMNVPIGFVYQYILFSESPNIFETVGAVIMLSTGLIEIAEEWYHYRQAQSKLALHHLEQCILEDKAGSVGAIDDFDSAKANSS